MSNKTMRTGFTTGSCAAAGAKAATLAWLGAVSRTVDLLTPQGRIITVPVFNTSSFTEGGQASVVKDAGDDPDITHGAIITVKVIVDHTDQISIEAGEGVGRVTKPGLAVAVGQPAVNPGPRTMITQAVREVLPAGRGARVIISVENGAELAKRTLNPVLGIEGGLSIIGTTGIVEPMSEEAFKNSLTPQISVVKALGYSSIVFTPGKIGQDIAANRFGLPREAVVQTSNFIGHMLEQAVELGIKEVLILGHLGKIVKVAAGIFHTHNRIADARLETIAAYAAANGAPQSVVRDILDCTTTEAAIPIITDNGLACIYDLLAARASSRAVRYVFDDLVVGTAIVTLAGELLGLDQTALKIGGNFGWNLK